jgi:hypothetical protein
MDDSRLVLVQGQSPPGQSSRQLVPYAFSLPPAVAADGEVSAYLTVTGESLPAHPALVPDR